jgi:hypothetical protein
MTTPLPDTPVLTSQDVDTSPISSTPARGDDLDPIWASVVVETRTRGNDIHLPISLAYAERLCDAYPAANRLLVRVAILLHDVGWARVDETRIIRGLQRRLAPGGDPLRTREQGCIIAREVLPPLGYDAVFVDEVCRIVDVTTPAPRQSLSRMRWSVTPTGCGGSTTPASPSPPAGSGWIRRSTPTGSPRRSSRSCSPRRASPWPPPIWNGRGPC